MLSMWMCDDISNVEISESGYEVDMMRVSSVACSWPMNVATTISARGVQVEQ